MTPPDPFFTALTATWPAAELHGMGPWTLRRGAGGGNRTSAATLDGEADAPDGLPAEAEAAMRGWGQRPLVMVRPGEDGLDAALEGRGWGAHDATRLLAAPVEALAAPGDLVAIPSELPLAAMESIWAGGGIGPGRLAVMARAPGARTYILGRLGDRPAGAAFVAVEGSVAMLHALEVAGFARRRGLAVRMTRAAADWAQAAGAKTLALAVTRANTGAQALYEGLGMTEAGAYHYRIAPETRP